jgi:hypothetical protein
MSGYVKLFSDIIESSIWQEDAETTKVWITLLALCDQDGYVRGSTGWLASKARVREDACARALQKFQNPDPSSRTPDNEGRRIEQLEDGWLILNYLAFRDRLSTDSKAVSSRERVRKHRERYRALRNAESVTPPASADASVSASSPDGESEGKGTKAAKISSGRCSETEAVIYGQEIGLPTEEAKKFFDYYTSKGWLVGRTPMKDYRAAMRNWKRNSQQTGSRNGNRKNGISIRADQSQFKQSGTKVRVAVDG